MKSNFCKQCGEYLGYKSDALYCSGACKAKAYRARVKAEKAIPDTFGAVQVDDRSPVEKAIETKKNEQRFKRCPHCWNEFPVNGLQKARRYCSDACKQASYRQRHGLDNYLKNQSTRTIEREELPIEDNLTEQLKDAWSGALGE